MSGNEARARRSAAYLERLVAREARLAAQEAATIGDLRDEVGILRYVMVRVVNEVTDVREMAGLLPRIVNAVRGALLAERVVSGDSAADLTEALTKVLVEMGLAE